MDAKKYEIPNDNHSLRTDIKSNKDKYMRHIYESFKIINKEQTIPKKINLFKFKNTNLEIIVKEESYVANLKNLLDYYSELEEYELCTVILSTIKYINKNNENKD